VLRTRVIPCLLLKGRGLVKTMRFKDPKYLGDPINAVKIFNEKEVDELVLLDIAATNDGRGPSFKVVEEIASECFMPLAYGGGIRSVDDIHRVLALGVEKVVLNTAAAEHPDLVRHAAERFGSQAVVVSIDVRKKLFGGYEVMTRSGTHGTGLNPVEYSQLVAQLGAGEILLNAIDRDGMQRGYDVDLIKQVTSAVKVPVIAIGGAGRLEHLALAAQAGGAAAAAAGSLFVLHGPHRAVLISYPSYGELRTVLDEQ
jgi:imidazole glycerol-phosphate synthase subunit HisF